MSDVIQILNAVAEGNQQAVNELFPVVYDELRRMASMQLLQENPGQTLQPTALVHEAFLRMVGSKQEAMANRQYFFTAAAEAMRRILVERARARVTQKRGAGKQRVDLEAVPATLDSSLDQVLDVDSVLSRLAVVEPQAAELVKLRYFAGFTVEESSEMMGLSLRSTHRLWGYAKAWLYEALHDAAEKTGK
jgi:RNA polymerase sigma factor (TIGR02999 family)